jgi:diguanylate cyclase (GGDEF)-like protein
MAVGQLAPELSPQQLLAIIRTQTEIAKLGLDLPGVMTIVAERSRAITGASGAVVELAEGDEMVYRAVSGVVSDQLGLRLKRSASLSGLCVATASVLRCDDSELDDRVDRQACRKVGLRSMVVVPLIHEGTAVGVLKVFSPVASAFGERDVDVLGTMSELIAAAMFHSVKFGADELFHQATTDSLTGLANRALFFDRLRYSIAKARRESRLLAALMVDMDGLKPINDRHGHRAGDAAIKEIASRLSADIRDSDTVARVGGDEFAMVLSDVDSRSSASMIGKRISKRCAGPFQFEGRSLAIGASVGVAIFPDDGDQPEVLLERADQSMYVAKQAKKRSRDLRGHS